MAKTTLGSIRDRYADGVAMQPDRGTTEKDDGSIDGTILFECHREDMANLPAKGDKHPDDSRLELYSRVVSYGRQGMVQMTGSYFGIVAPETEPILSCATDPDRLPIVLHPKFRTVLGGTSASPKNSARFDPETGEFLGFFNEASSLFGVEYFFSPSCQVSLSYWTRRAPTLKRLMTIHNSIRGFRKPEGVKDFLLIGSPYRQVGTHFQVTENYLGSGPDGWNPVIYS